MLGSIRTLIEDMRLAAIAPRPRDDFVLVSLEHDDGRVSGRGATDGGVWVINQSVGVLSDVTWCTGD